MERAPHVRASDADRERVVEALQDHCANGRLTMEEFSERLDAAYAAKTYAELDALLVDLPSSAYDDLPIPASVHHPDPVGRPAWAASFSVRQRAAWGAWLRVSLLCWTIWAIVLVTSGLHDWAGLWPLWVSGPWGAVLVARSLSGGSDERSALERARQDRAYVDRRAARRLERDRRRIERHR